MGIQAQWEIGNGALLTLHECDGAFVVRYLEQGNNGHIAGDIAGAYDTLREAIDRVMLLMLSSHDIAVADARAAMGIDFIAVHRDAYATRGD